ncbi:PREDICTED: uncharacterized protein LOC104803573 isoform X2 [Tarenaya hassleriana]|uniref:uncharacterized protein LOC104803573 isoform X2 n=1 Tax=Tarenaya hassleriana TaxID=28532 RepID=UPI00053C6C6A|nr:PREDICTED: uncharacterized protein LOC104803573 isoform X2 [Tarenaya hassleriana]
MAMDHDHFDFFSISFGHLTISMLFPQSLLPMEHGNETSRLGFRDLVTAKRTWIKCFHQVDVTCVSAGKNGHLICNKLTTVSSLPRAADNIACLFVSSPPAPSINTSITLRSLIPP